VLVVPFRVAGLVLGVGTSEDEVSESDSAESISLLSYRESLSLRTVNRELETCDFPVFDAEGCSSDSDKLLFFFGFLRR